MSIFRCIQCDENRDADADDGLEAAPGGGLICGRCVEASAEAAPTTSEGSGGFTPGPYRAEFGAIHHEDVNGFLFTVGRQSDAAEVAEALNAALLVPDLLEALKACRSQFESYALAHYRKQTAEGDEKALTNQRFATLCDEAIAKATGQGVARTPQSLTPSAQDTEVNDRLGEEG